MDAFLDFLVKWSPLAAWVALIAPWLPALWRRLFERSEIDIHEAGLLEIGYSLWGPTVSLHGTLRAVGREQFVSELELEVIRESDRSQHTFPWTVMRSTKAHLSGQQDFEVELPAGFLLTPVAPYRFSILFSDTTTRQQMDPPLLELKQRWETYIKTPDRQGEVLAARQVGSLSQKLQAIFKDFSREEAGVVGDVFSELDRICYWQAGDYRISLVVKTSRPEQDFVRSWRFQLTGADERTLRSNRLRIMDDVCQIPHDDPYAFANTPFLDLAE